MTIDEALKDFKETKEILIEAKNNNKDEVFENIDKNISQCEIAIEALELMCWHREQDLIRRSDAIAMTKEILFLNTAGISIDQCGDKAIACMHEIPKAEPPNHIGEPTEMEEVKC